MQRGTEVWLTKKSLPQRIDLSELPHLWQCGAPTGSWEGLKKTREGIARACCRREELERVPEGGAQGGHLGRRRAENGGRKTEKRRHIFFGSRTKDDWKRKVTA